MAIKLRMQNQLELFFNPQLLEIVDDSARHAGHAGVKGMPSGETHFNITLVSEHFKGKTRIQRHQMVYDAVQQWMNHPIHALQLTLKTPEELE